MRFPTEEKARHEKAFIINSTAREIVEKPAAKNTQKSPRV
jgi:hypothetical protein